MKDRIAAAAAVVSAALASVCCIGPVVLAALGLGGVGLAAGLEKYRPYFLLATAILLGIGFFQAYRHRDESCSGGDCKTGASSHSMRRALWIIAAVGVASFPSWAPLLLRHSPRAAAADAKTIKLTVSGMDCAACAVGIEKSLKKVPGVQDASIDFDKGEATVYADRGRVSASDLLHAVQSAGPYSARLEENRHDQ